MNDQLHPIKFDGEAAKLILAPVIQQILLDVNLSFLRVKVVFEDLSFVGRSVSSVFQNNCCISTDKYKGTDDKEYFSNVVEFPAVLIVLNSSTLIRNLRIFLSHRTLSPLDNPVPNNLVGNFEPNG